MLLKEKIRNVEVQLKDINDEVKERELATKQYRTRYQEIQDAIANILYQTFVAKIDS